MPSPSDPRDRLMFFEAAPQPCLVLGQDMRIRDVNYAFSQATGWSLEDVAGRALGEYMEPDAARALRETFLALEWHTISSTRLAIRCKDGRPMHLQWLLRGMPERNKVYCILEELASTVSPPSPGVVAQPQAAQTQAAEPQAAPEAPVWARRHGPILVQTVQVRRGTAGKGSTA